MIDAHAPVETFDEIDSTILEARRRAERSELGPVWLIARTQTAGRGRRGRAWSSLDAVDEIIGAGQATLKWPNDVQIGGAKIAGIMLDSGSLGDAGIWVALAFGVNLAVAPENLDQRTTSLRTLLPPDAPAPEPLDFLARVRPKLEGYAARMEREGFEPLRQAWLKRAHGLGHTARVVQGEQTLEGRIAGLSSRGELELDTSEGRRLIAAGDVFLPNAA
jgi:BirA family biotin operon repressor/biotin-[acetyl-CoA-carboxylase] ligase